MYTARDWRSSDRASKLAEGTRGDGGTADVGVETFAAGDYPSCSTHGAMVCVAPDRTVWRCLAPGCNVGTRTDPWQGQPIASRWSICDDRAKRFGSFDDEREAERALIGLVKANEDDAYELFLIASTDSGVPVGPVRMYEDLVLEKVPIDA